MINDHGLTIEQISPAMQNAFWVALATPKPAQHHSARTQHPIHTVPRKPRASGEDLSAMTGSDIANLAAFVVIVGLVIWAIIAATKANARRQLQVQASLDTFNAEPLHPVPTPGIPIHPGEVFYFHGPATWGGQHTERVYEGGSAGGSFRVARGIWIRSGATRGHSRNVAVADRTSGEVFISNQRVIFVGGGMSHELRMGSWVHATAYRDGLGFDLANKPTVYIFSSNPFMGETLSRIVSGRIGSQISSRAVATTANNTATSRAQVGATQTTAARLGEASSAISRIKGQLTSLAHDTLRLILPSLTEADFADMWPFFGERKIVTSVNCTTDTSERREWTITAPKVRWEQVSAGERQTAIVTLRTAMAKALPTGSPDVAYVTVLDENGEPLAQATPNSITIN